MFRFESPEVGVRSPQGEERGGRDLMQPVRVRLQANGQTEGFGVTMPLSLAGRGNGRCQKGVEGPFANRSAGTHEINVVAADEDLSVLQRSPLSLFEAK
jgi:hypothetical protein